MREHEKYAVVLRVVRNVASAPEKQGSPGVFSRASGCFLVSE
jgi:hypothetical protein